jgi:hypothetical protein
LLLSPRKVTDVHIIMLSHAHNGKGGTKDIQDDVPSVREHCGFLKGSLEPSSIFFIFILLLRDLLTKSVVVLTAPPNL